MGENKLNYFIFKINNEGIGLINDKHINKYRVLLPKILFFEQIIGGRGLIK